MKRLFYNCSILFSDQFEMKSFLLALIVGILINENRLAQCADVGSQMFSSECEALKNRWIVDIEPAEQELLAQKAEIDCDNKLESYWLNATANANACYPMWDTVLCWPETSLNTTIQISCPNYILRFNMKSKKYFQLYTVAGFRSFYRQIIVKYRYLTIIDKINIVYCIVKYRYLTIADDKKV